MSIADWVAHKERAYAELLNRGFNPHYTPEGETMIKPTVGRVVHYYPDDSENIKKKTAEPLAAVIAAVLDDRLVNLTVSDYEGSTHPRVRVVLVQEGDLVPHHSHTRWMPFQVGQAQKTEELNKQLDVEREKANMKREKELVEREKALAERGPTLEEDSKG